MSPSKTAIYAALPVMLNGMNGSMAPEKALEWAHHILCEALKKESAS